MKRKFILFNDGSIGIIDQNNKGHYDVVFIHGKQPIYNTLNNYFYHENLCVDWILEHTVDSHIVNIKTFECEGT